MGHGITTSNLVRRLVGALGVLMLLATACGSDDPGTIDSPTTLAPTDTAPGAATEATPPTDGLTPTTSATGGPAPTDGGAPAGTAGPTGAPAGLAGLWAGEYKSTVPPNADGTFTVVFEGSAPDYSGSIVIAGLCEPDCPITANVTGNTIGFGSVGPRAVTYKGTISGNSMSGTYTVGTEGQGNGTWSAVKG